MKRRISTDMQVDGDKFHYYFGTVDLTLDSELMIIFTQVPPYGVDPSARLAWFELLRMQWRRRYRFNFREWELRLAGSESDHDSGNCLAPVIERFVFFTRGGDSCFNCTRCTATRVCDYQRGPNTCALASIQMSMRFHWVTQTGPSSGDVRRRIVFPDVSQFSVDGYDTLADFRCTNAMIDEWTIS
jgi:hypothetical protein